MTTATQRPTMHPKSGVTRTRVLATATALAVATATALAVLLSTGGTSPADSTPSVSQAPAVPAAVSVQPLDPIEMLMRIEQSRDVHFGR